MIRRPPRSTRFPDTTLFRSAQFALANSAQTAASNTGTTTVATSAPTELKKVCETRLNKVPGGKQLKQVDKVCTEVDRKSTRLNSSHANISYAVFCLKKNKHA